MCTQILVTASEWEEWLRDVCTRNGWKHSASPLVWRELVDRGGKGLYVGGINEFVEYARHYYGMEPATSSQVEMDIAAENDQTLHNVRLSEKQTTREEHIVVCVTRASSPLAYHLLAHIAAGAVFSHSPVEVRLLDGEEVLPMLEGIAMELIDMASPHLVGVACSSSPEVAFAGVSVVFVLDPTPAESVPDGVGSGDEVRPTPEAALTYTRYAEAMDRVAHRDTKVLVCGQHLNTIVALITRSVSLLDKRNIVGSPALTENRARARIASRLGLNASCVGHVAILGRGKGEVAVDLTTCEVRHYPGPITGPAHFTLPVQQCILDPEWIQAFPSLVTNRPLTAAVMCEAACISEHMKDWVEKTAQWRSVVMVPSCVFPEVPEGVALSLPATCSSGHWTPTITSIPPHMLPSVRQQAASLEEELKVVMETLPK